MCQVYEEIRLIFDVQLYYSKMIESLSESTVVQTISKLKLKAAPN